MIWGKQKCAFGKEVYFSEYTYNNFFRSLLCYFFLFDPPRIHASRNSRLALQGVEKGSNYLHRSPASRESDGKRTQLRGYNWATLFLGDINTGIWAPVWGSLESETVKYGHEPCGTRTSEWMRWRGPAAIVNDKPILSSESMLHKDYDRRCSIEKKKFWQWVSRGLAPRRTDLR
jgi:hypothetical protein